jgi:hypothetical protein
MLGNILVNWGSAAVGAASSVAVVFSKAYTNANPQVAIGGQQALASNDGAYVTAISKTGCSLGSVDAATVGYIAIGT